MTGRVSVRGAGVGSLTAASLLSRRRWEVEVYDVPRRRPPALVLNELTQTLLGDVFGPGVLEGGYVLQERCVRWGTDATETRVPTTWVALDGAVLLTRLRRDVVGDRRSGEADWVIDGTGRGGANGRPRRSYGGRVVLQVEVSLVTTGARSSWIETVDEGWVHLAPVAADRAILQAMVPVAPADPARALGAITASTRGISRRVGEWQGAVSVFPAAPSAVVAPCGPGWMSVADAAVSIDPVSGSGTAWAVRGGILAAAVIDAVASGLPADECLRHYSDRLGHAIAEHVDHCLRLYDAAFSSPSWKEELALMAAARADTRRQRAVPTFGYRLDGFRLERLPTADDCRTTSSATSGSGTENVG